MHPADSIPVAEWLELLLARSRERAVIFLTPAGEITGWLGAAERLFGYSAAEAIGRPFEQIFVAEDRRLGLHTQEISVALAVGRSEDDRWHLRKDGTRFWGSGLLEPVLDAGGGLLGLCKMLRDRTDVRMQLDALQHGIEAQAMDAAARAAQAVQAGHELRNTVGPVLSAVRILQSSDDPVLKRQGCDVLARQVAVMKRVLDDLLSVAGGSVSSVQIQMEPVVLQDVLEAAVNALRASAADAELELHLLVPPVPISFQADPIRLQQVLLNLLSNAIKYTPAGGHIALTGTVEGAMVVIRVEDDGMGIASSVLPHIFELFTREDRAAGTRPGLGVGLAVVKEIVALHGGAVEARSPGKGHGTIMTVRLPFHRASPG
jgi:PAS domain S-box-containing protein